MKTMLELLIRLHEMRCCCERVRRNPQLTSGEKSVVCSHKQLVRECLPVTVLAHYDRMKKTERTLLTCPEVFAMAVLVSTYRSLSRLQRGRLVRHFATSSRTQNNAVQCNVKARSNRNTVRHFQAVACDVARKSWQ
jgi:hypothetical protein